MSERSVAGGGAGDRRVVARGDRLAAARFGVAFEAGLRADGLRVGAFRDAGLRRAGRDVLEAAALEARLRTCLVRASRRFIAMSRSAWRAVRSSRACTCLIAVCIVFWPSSTVRSICLRTSGGIRLCASRSADLPAFTACLRSFDRVDARFLAAITTSTNNAQTVRITHRVRMAKR